VFGFTVVEVVDVEDVEVEVLVEVEVELVLDVGMLGTVQPKVANRGSSSERAPGLAR
jgi:hypothetical protein